MEGANELPALKDKITKDCELYNARAYINLNFRSRAKVGLKVIALAAEFLNTQANSNAWKGIYFTAMSNTSALKPKHWLMDVDDPETLSLVCSTVVSRGGTEVLLNDSPSGGFHLICTPFDTRNTLSGFDLSDLIHKEPLTILYAV